MVKKTYTSEQKAQWVAWYIEEIQRTKKLLDRIEKFYRNLLTVLPAKK